MRAARQAVQDGVRMQQEGVSSSDIYAIYGETHQLQQYGDQGANLMPLAFTIVISMLIS